MRRVEENANTGVAQSVRGLEVACRFFWEVGLPALEKSAPAYLDRIAAGLIAAGSDCSGNDDAVSRDYDWGPRFQVFLTGSDYAAIAGELQLVLDDLPDHYEGAHCRPSGDTSNPVYSIDDFFARFTACGTNCGFPSAPVTAVDWLSIPESSLFELTHGQVFYDPLGQLSDRRQGFMSYYPDDAWRRRLAESLTECHNHGQKLLPRAIERDDYYTAQIAWWRFSEEAMRLGFLLNRRFAPQTKWLYREFCKLPELSVEVVNCLWDGQGDVLCRPELVARIAHAYDVKLADLGIFSTSLNGAAQSFVVRAKEVAASIVDPKVAQLVWSPGQAVP